MFILQYPILMNRHLIISVAIFCITKTAVATDTVYMRVSNPWNTVKDMNGKFKRMVVINDSGCLVLDYNSKNFLITRGYYTDTTFSVKINKHLYFHELDYHLEEERNYKDGMLDGDRIGYDGRGDTLFKETYLKGRFLARKEYEAYTKPIMLSRIDSPASFANGEDGWRDYMVANMQYPKVARQYRIEGYSKVKFVISKEGQVIDISILESAHPLLDAEAIRLLHASPAWEPAKFHGKTVPFVIVQNVFFYL